MCRQWKLRPPTDLVGNLAGVVAVVAAADTTATAKEKGKLQIVRSAGRKAQGVRGARGSKL